MMNGKFDPNKYRGRQTGGGIAGMYSKKTYMIPVNSNAKEEETNVVGQSVTPMAAVEERAKSEMKDAIKENIAHVPIKRKNRKRKASSKRSANKVTRPRREKRLTKKENTKTKKGIKRKQSEIEGFSIFKKLRK